MTISEAKRMVREFEMKDNPNEEDLFLFTEAMNFLINETKDPNYMMYLGGVYYDNKDFKLARKYYEMAAEYDIESAHCCLGYIFYYGRTEEPDYKKALYHFEKSAALGNIQSAYKVADMYKNGYGVEKNYDKYKEIVEGLWPRIENAMRLDEPYPEIATRLAGIRAKEGEREEAIWLYQSAKEFLSQRMRYDGFFGNYTIMKLLIMNLYELIELPMDDLDFWDLYEVLRKPCEVTFRYNRGGHTIKCMKENEELIYSLDDHYFRNLDDLMKKGTLGDGRLGHVAGEIYMIEVK